MAAPDNFASARSEIFEKALMEAFPLKAVRVLEGNDLSYHDMLVGLGQLAATYFDAIFEKNTVVGVSWGTALYEMIKAVQSENVPGAEVVQLIGATGTEHNPTDGPILAQLLAEKLGAVCHYLHSPLIVEDEATRNALFNEPTIRNVLMKAEQAQIALVGIGSTKPSLYSLTKAGYVSESYLDAIRAAGAVGDICAQHYNNKGEWLDININRRVMGVTLQTLAGIDTVIGVAGGKEKSETILAALRGHHINVLITDVAAAKTVLSLHSQEKEPTSISVEHAIPVVSLKNIWKVFDGVPVLRGVSIDVKPGEIHALLGGNGSGKSTLMKTLSGIYSLDAGEIFLEGTPVAIENPSYAHKMGIYLVPQEPKIFPHLSVEENILIGMDVDPAQARDTIKQLAKDLGFEENIFSPAGRLSIANQQLLEIIRGLLHNVKVLILDEPTSTLTFREVDALFARLRKLAKRGIGIFFISHRLQEILEISDRVSVLRDGNFVLSAATQTLDSRDLVRAMLPDDTTSDRQIQRERVSSAKFGKPILRVEHLSGEAFQDVTFQVRAGEVVGVAGLVGSGRTELAEGIFGIDTHVTGNVFIDGEIVKNRTPRRCLDMGLVYVPEDRHAHGVFLELPNGQTITASILKKLGRILLSFRRERMVTGKFITQLQIKSTGPQQITRTLSGGNQQKVVLAKSMAGNPKVVILDEPTRGVDAQARQDVYHLIKQLSDQGVGIMLISSDFDEVIHLSDRVLVMYHGEIVDEMTHSECQIERITESAFGLKGAL